MVVETLGPQAVLQATMGLQVVLEGNSVGLVQREQRRHLLARPSAPESTTRLRLWTEDAQPSCTMTDTRMTSVQFQCDTVTGLCSLTGLSTASPARGPIAALVPTQVVLTVKSCSLRVGSGDVPAT